MSLITPDFGLIFWMTLVFAVVFFLLAKFGFPIITGMVEKRADTINESIRKTEEARLQLEQMATTQQQMISEARNEQARIIKEASAAGEAIVQQAKEKAEAEASKIIESAKVQIAAERESAMRDVRTQVALLSVEVAGKLMRKSLEQSSEQQNLLNTLVEEASKAEMN